MPHPSPAWLLVLWLSLPGLVVLGRELSIRATTSMSCGRALSPALVTSCWLVLVHFAGNLTHSFFAAIILAAAILSAMGLVLARRPLPRRPTLFGWLVPPTEEWSGMGAAAVFSLGLMIVFHGRWSPDELLVTGELATVSQLVGGSYPPVHLVFPSFVLPRAHGFDVLAATLSIPLRLEAPSALWLTKLLIGFYLGWLAFKLASKMSSPRAGVLVLLLLFASRLPIPCSTATGVLRWTGECPGPGNVLGPPLVAHLVEPGVGLGLGLSFALLLLVAEEPTAATPLLSGLLLVSSALANRVSFFVVGTSVVVASLMGGRKRLAVFAGLAIGVTALMVDLRQPDGSLSIGLRAMRLDSLSATTTWFAAGLGPLLLLGLLGAARGGSSRERTVLGFMAALGFILTNHLDLPDPHHVEHATAMAASSLALLAAPLLSSLGRRAALIVVCFVTSGGLMFAAGRFATRSEGPRPVELEADDLLALIWLRRETHPVDLVFRSQPSSLGYAQWGGIATAWMERQSVGRFRFPADRLRTRSDLASTMPLAPSSYVAEGVRFVVIGPEPFGPGAPHLRAWMQAGKATERGRFGPLLILELTK
ncbi:MAG: hypothetical protein HY791_04215 [Deltaproteobacteria bacterium]|nr:hypothetical protein [Deltaproteobacteria bacterium]